MTTKNITSITIHQTQITTTAAARAIGKPIGTYINIDAPKIGSRRLAHVLSQELTNLLPQQVGKILVIGLGNKHFIADSLGPRVLEKIVTNQQCLTFTPNVFGVTGINSVDAIKAITKLVQPNAVFVIDSLVSADPARIGTNYQICTSGITPGSGLGRNNQTIDQHLLGVPVIALGVPVCTILKVPYHLYHVVPKDIDFVIQNCARKIAAAINILVRRN